MEFVFEGVAVGVVVWVGVEAGWEGVRWESRA